MSDRYFSTSVYRKGATPSDAPLLFIEHEAALEDRKIKRVRRVVLEPQMPEHPAAHGTPALIDFLTEPDVEPAVFPFSRIPKNFDDEDLRSTSSVVFVEDPEIRPDGSLEISGEFIINTLWRCPLSALGGGFALRLRLKLDGTALLLDVGQVNKGASCVGTRDRAGWDLLSFQEIDDTTVDAVKFEPLGNWLDRPLLASVVSAAPANWSPDDVPVLRALLQDEPPQTASWINQHLGGHPRFAAGLVLRSAARSEGAMRLPGGGGLAAMIWIDKADGQPGTTRTPLRPELLGLSPAHPFWIVYPEDGHGALFLGGEDRGALDGAGRTPRRDNWQFSFRIDEHPTETLYKFGASVERLWRDAISRPVIMGLRGLDSDRSVSLLPADLPYRDPGVLRANWFDKTRTLPHSDTPISTDDFLKGWWTRFAVRVGDQAAPEFLGPPSLCPPPTTSEPWQNGNLMGHAQRRDLTFPELRLADGTAATRRIDVAPIDIDPLAPVRLAPLGAESGTEALAAPAEETALLDLALRPAELAGAELLPDALRPLDNSILLGSMLFDLADQDTMISPPAPILLGRAGRLSVVLRSSDGQAAISAVPFFAIDLSFGLRRVVPATQDLGRTRDDDAKGIWAAPLVVPLSDTFSAGKTALSFAERTRAERGRDRVSHRVLVELRLLEGVGVDDDEDALIDAVVLDPTPFLAGRVLSRLSTPEGSALAVLEIGSGTTEVWRLDSRDSDEVALLLPPQVTGEEMIKGKLTRPPDGTPIPDPDNLPFDFKNAPATRLLIDRSIQPRARTLAPWNLRAMLGFVESDAPGAGLVAVESELLYGLGYVWTPEGTRLAELEAWGGRLVDTDIPDLTSGDQGDVRATGYREHYSKWRTSLQTRAAQLVPYKQLRATDETSGERRLESFTDGVRHRFRPTRRTADPFQLDNYARDRRRASGQTPGLTDSDTLPLAGGVDLLFEAETIYDEVLRSPDSVDGRLGNLAFGALGGDGAQEARFANGKTLIASVTESGFTRSIRLERIGRIAMLWNVAKHVIVYERTVKTPRRYEGDQPPDFEGIAAMRKVREYVEILEPTRRYPDFGEADRETGPLRGSRFVSTKIDVRSDWGYATENGWAMPLAGPVPAGIEQFYPIPEILLNLARARGRGGGEVAQLCTSPERLVFYTSTREEDGTQTDLWPSVRDVDFPVLPLPSAPSMSHPSFPVDGLAADPDGKLPDPERMEPGMDRFSVSLKRSEDPVNLTLGRAGDGLEARVESICLARANPFSSGQGEAAQSAQRLTDGDRALRDALDRLGTHVARARDGLPVNTQHARRDADRAKTILDRYKDSLAPVQAGASPWDTFWDSQKTRQDAWKRRVEKVADDLIRDLRKELTSLVVNPGDEEKIKLRLRGYVEGIFQQLAAELQGMDIVLEEVLREVRGAADAIVADLSTRLETSGMRVLSRLERISLDGDEVSAADLARLRDDLSPVIVAARTQLRTSLRTLPNRLFGPLSGIFNKAGGLDISAADNLVALIDTILDEIAEALQTADEDDPDGLPAPVMLERIRVAGEALRFDVTDEIAATLSDLADKLLAQTANGTSLRDLLRELFGKKASLAVDLEKRRADILGLLDDLGNIGGLLNDIEAAFRDLIDPATGELKELFDGVANLGTEAKEALKEPDLRSG